MTDLSIVLVLIMTAVLIAVFCALAVMAWIIDRNRGLFGDALPKDADERWY